MEALLTGSLRLRLLHALIPSHWLPIVVIGQSEQLSVRQLLTITAVAGLAHTISTTLLGALVSLAAGNCRKAIPSFPSGLFRYCYWP